MSRFVLILFFTLSLCFSAGVHAQLGDYEQEDTVSPNSPDAPENEPGFTGTYADEEDPEDPKYQDKIEEDALFGEEDAREEDDAGKYEEDDRQADPDASREADPDPYGENEIPEDEPNYLLKFDFESSATFLDKLTGDPYMEINYHTTIEKEVTLSKKRFRTKARADFETDIVGNYAGNELFTCKLEIDIKSAPVQLMTIMRDVSTPEDDIPLFEAALQLKFEKGYKEDWYSNCTGLDGSLFNTRGDPEKYNLMILEDTTPPLKTILLEDFIPGDNNEIEIIMEPLEVEDPDADTVLLTGKGTLFLEILTGN